MKLTKIALLTSVLSLIMIGCGGAPETVSLQSQSTSTGETLTTNSVVDDLQYDDNGKITTINASGNVESVAVSREALFFAEGENGVEIISIGYSDKISTELLFKIKDINAQQVTLSEDELTLYVEDEVGLIHIIDISDLTHPVETGQTTKQSIDNSALSKNGTYKYIPRGEEGLEIVNVSNPSNIFIESTFKISNAFDVVLADNDNKALIATGMAGINLLDITNPKQVDNIASYTIGGSSVTGLSLNTNKDILFVATGDKGVLVFNLDILLRKLGY